MKAGFYGGVVVDYPESTKKKKHFLVLMTGGNMPLPEALTDQQNSNQASFISKRSGLLFLRFSENVFLNFANVLFVF